MHRLFPASAVTLPAVTLPAVTLLALALFSAALPARPAAAASDKACEAAETLARVHDRYHAVVQGTDDLRARSAAQLHGWLPTLNARGLANLLAEGGTEVDADRLSRILDGARRLSRDLITGTPPTMVGLAPHIENVDWLAETVRASGCLSRFAEPEQADGAETLSAGTAIGAGGEGQPLFGKLVLPLLALLGLGAVAYAVHAIRKSRTYRVMQVARLPRHFTTAVVDVAYETPARGARKEKVTGLDISAGGMKLAWPEAPPRGTLLKIRTPLGERTASIVWSNAHYAGIMFDQVMTEDELDLMRA